MRRIAYAGFRNLKLASAMKIFTTAIAKTVDGGGAGRSYFGNRPSRRQPRRLLIEPRAAGGGDNVFFDAPDSLGVAPGNADVCYATDLFRTYRTLDGGKTWAQVNSVRVGDSRWTTRGLDVNYQLRCAI